MSKNLKFITLDKIEINKTEAPPDPTEGGVIYNETGNSGLWWKQAGEPVIDLTYKGIDPQVFSAFDTIGGVSISATADIYTPLTLNLESKKTSAFTHTASSSEVTVTLAGTYVFTSHISTTITSASDTVTKGRLAVNTGGGFNPVEGTDVYLEHTDSASTMTTSFTIILDAAIGDIFRIEVARHLGTGNVQTGTDSSLNIYSPGNNGPPGVQGVAGSGSTIVLENKSVALANTPHQTLNFEGNKITAVDAGGGKALISIDETLLNIGRLQNATTIVDISASSAPISGYVLKASSSTLAAWSTIDTGDITTGTFDNNRFVASNITQFEGSIDHTNILNAGTYTHAAIDSHINDTTLHRVIDDGSVTTTTLWSSSKINTTKISLTEKGAANGVAELDGSGTVPLSQLPAGIGGGVVVQVVADITALNALTPDEGDITKVTDSDGSGNPSTYAYDGTAWMEFEVPANVLSVNTQTGAVVLDTDDISEAANLYYTDARVSNWVNTQKGAVNGIVPLNGIGLIDSKYLSLSSVTYKGSWNASTNTPTIVSSTGTQGDYYVVSIAGTTLIDGISVWNVGDWIIFNGSEWEKLDQSDLVTSVAGKIGAVTLQLADITDLATTDDLPEGTTNLYYDTADVDSRASAQITAVTGVANGIVPLNGSTQIDSKYLNISSSIFKGVWNANTNTPLLDDNPVKPIGTVNGDYYTVSVAGTPPGPETVDGGSSFAVGDQVIYNSTSLKWDKIPNTSGVTSVAGKTGAVSLVIADITDLTAGSSSIITTAERTKLSGIEALADVTDTANVSAAGALLRAGGIMTGDIDMNGNDLKIVDNTTNGFSIKTINGDLLTVKTTTGFEELRIAMPTRITGSVTITEITAPGAPATGSGTIYNETGNDGLWWHPSGGASIDITDHNNLVNYDIKEHRIINDSGTSATELWSASKIDTEKISNSQKAVANGVATLDANGTVVPNQLDLVNVTYNITNVTAATYTIVDSDEYVHVDYTTTGSVVITLPAATTTKKFTISDTGGNACNNNISIVTSGGDTIFGETDMLLDISWSTVTLLYDTVDKWTII